jgi:ABC-2 type transport system permease protein
MKKTWIIIKREYLSRVKKRSFIILTIIGPVLIAALMIVPYFIAKSTEEQKVIDVVDETTIFRGKLGNTKNIRFNYLDTDINTACDNFDESTTYVILYIPRPTYTKPQYAELLYQNKQPGMTVTTYIRERLQYVMENKILKDQFNIDKKDLDATKSRVTLTQKNITTGEKSAPVLTSILGYAGGFLIYMFIFMFGSMVMRGVLEEKTNRIVEVIVSSVRPFQLMMGKIIGIAMVGLTQVFLWIVLTMFILGIFQASVVGDNFLNAKQQDAWVLDKNVVVPDPQEMQAGQTQNAELIAVLNTIKGYDFVAIIALFVFFFLFGYLMYASLFAAVGSAADNETDTQQFMMPITIPLIFAFIMGIYIIEDPQGPLAFWLSVIPLTSPVVMMIRLPFGVPAFDLYLSMALLVLAFIGTTWLAGKIYRTGILMYGKKVNYRELWKWITYKN